MRGSPITARNPAASTAPSSELAESLVTTPGPGRLWRVTDSTSSSSFGGAMRGARRLTKRSITSARATTEQINSGQIGQPAACMIENKRELGLWMKQRVAARRRAIMAELDARLVACCHVRRECDGAAPRRISRMRHQQSTASVEKLVG